MLPGMEGMSLPSSSGPRLNILPGVGGASSSSATILSSAGLVKRTEEDRKPGRAAVETNNESESTSSAMNLSSMVIGLALRSDMKLMAN